MPLFRRILIGLGASVLALLLALAAYAAYLQATYYRVPDNQAIEIENNSSEGLKARATYTAVSYNIGFGAYTPDYTFFMDEGAMADGTETKGVHGRAVSEQSVRDCTTGDIDLVKTIDPDFALLQEVDTDSDRSFHVNQKSQFEQAFPAHASAWSSNFHSAFLAYPFNEPHGTVNAGLLTLAKAGISSAQRRSYPIDESFPTKFFDLDRCFQVMRMPVDNGRELVLVNSHMSAYDKSGLVRARQLELLKSLLGEEAAAGNYVVCGGDWNHALAGSVDLYPSEQQVPAWVAVMGDEDLPAGFSIVKPGNLADVATCRGCDIPYEKGVTYTATVDGFIVSDNVRATAENIENDFSFSDHNPVKLTFELS